VETAKFVADKLRSFGLEPRTGVARHGVVALLLGARPGPVVALRADMDGLPVTEETGLPFASRAKGDYDGRAVGVMHACGHDTHIAMLLAAARVLTGMRSELGGSVKFIFQPAEEGAPRGEGPAGAQAMVQEGVLDNPEVDAIFGLHVYGNMPTGQIAFRSGPMMAASDSYEVVVRGRQTHGATPWAGVDPIVVGSQIVLALQTIVSRQVNITAQPAIVTVGQFESGVRNNIIPESARLVGTIRTFDAAMQNDIHERVRRTAERIADAAGATAAVTITRGYPVTVNDPGLTGRMLPTLRRVVGEMAVEGPKITGAEDFSYFQQKVPGLFMLLGVTPPAQVGKAPQNHSPLFFVDEAALKTGVRVLTNLTLDYMNMR
jgi:amidohydrolase